MTGDDALRDRALQAMRHVAAFSGLSDADLKSLAAGAIRREYRRGEMVARATEQARVFVVRHRREGSMLGCAGGSSLEGDEEERLVLFVVEAPPAGPAVVRRALVVHRCGDAVRTENLRNRVSTSMESDNTGQPL